MPDREKVINELVEHIESALSVDSDYIDCVRTDLLQYTVALLKEQEHKDKMYHALEEDWKRLKAMLKEQEAETERLKKPTAGDNKIPLKW